MTGRLPAYVLAVLLACTIVPAASAVPNSPPSYTAWISTGDTIQEDNGVISTSPTPYTRTVANFITGIAPGPSAEWGTQTVNVVIVSQTNPSLFSSIVPAANLPPGTPASPPVYGPSFSVSGPAGSQAASLSYTTVPDANGVDSVCWQLQDSGGTGSGGSDVSAVACFDIGLTAVEDAPRPVGESFTIYKNQVLTVPAAAQTFPIAKPALPRLTANDVEPDGQPFTTALVTAPTKGTASPFGADGSFVYQPQSNYIGADSFVYRDVDSAGTASAPVTVSLTILDNMLPSAAFTPSSTSAVIGDALAFVSSCTDPDGSIVAWMWGFGDGFTSTDTSPLHAYAAPGNYQATLTCYDNHGDFATASQQIAVRTDGGGEVVASPDQYGSGPSAYAGENQNVPEGQWVHLHGYVEGGFAGASYAWTWTQLSGPTVWLQNATTQDPYFEAPTFQDAGPKAIVIQLVAGDGQAASLPSLVQVSVHSTNHPPVANAGKDQRVLQGEVATLDATGSTDEDGDTLRYEWTQLSGAPVCLQPPVQGCLQKPSRSIARNPTFTVPSFDAVPLTFQLLVADGEARSSSIVHVMALPPAAAASGFTYEVTATPQGSRVTFHTNVVGQAYVWDFGDGIGSSTQASPTYDYGHAGTYAVKLSVIDKDGVAQAYEKPLTLSNSERPAAPATPIEKHSPDAGPLVLLLLFGLALTGRRRR